MSEDKLSNKFYWENIVFKVEDEIFCVPRSGFVESSEVFADMFLLPSGSAESEGHERKNPILLEGYKKNEFECLLSVMYPTANSLISGKEVALRLNKKEWVSVLKLSVIWRMKKIRDYAIHKLSTDFILPPAEMVRLGREHKVAQWFEEGLTCLSSDHNLSFEDLCSLGWETMSRILWIRDNKISPFRFKKIHIKCVQCSSTIFPNDISCKSCGLAVLDDEDLTIPQVDFVPPPGNTGHLVILGSIQSTKCNGRPFASFASSCPGCSFYFNNSFNVKILCDQPSKETTIKEMFGDEIRDYEFAMNSP